MTKDDLAQQRAELERQHQAHVQKAAECVGAMRLIDYWLAELAKAETEKPA